MTGRAGLLVVAVAVAVAVLSACATIPDSGEVQTFSGSATNKDQVIRVLPREPREGASPTEIVAGFLTASASLDNDHAFARSYLSDAASKSWRPNSGVAVYDSDPGYRLAPITDGQVRMLALRSAGTISARGQFAQPTGGSQYRANFAVGKVDGQWRITGLANGLILSTSDIDRSYRSVNMFFLDIAGGVLVPDPLFLPAQQPGIETALTRELLAGPTAWLAPAVRTGFPAGTRLAIDAVPVEGGVARVDLTRVAVTATGEERRQMAAQLTYTLTQLPDVTSVRITLDGVPFSVPGVGATSTTGDWETFDPDAAPLDPSTYAIDDGHLAVVEAQATPLPGYFGKATNLTTAAVSLDGQIAAGVVPTSAGAEVRFGGTRAATVPVAYRGQRINSVSFDRLNSAWIADRFDGRTRVRALRSGSEPLAVRVDGLGTRSIEALRVSRDGARIALVVAETPGATGVLLIGRIQRGTGIPQVAGLRRVESSFSAVSDVAWADDSSLLVVAKRAAEPVQSFVVGIDGASVEGTGAVPSMLTVAACPGRPYLAGTATETIWVERGNGWRLFLTGRQPIYPG